MGVVRTRLVMKAFVSLIAFFGLSAALLPALVDAQDGKVEPKKTEEKKADAKKKAIPKADEVTILNAPKLKAKVKEVRAGEKDGDVKEIVVVTADQEKFN